MPSVLHCFSLLGAAGCRGTLLSAVRIAFRGIMFVRWALAHAYARLGIASLLSQRGSTASGIPTSRLILRRRTTCLPSFNGGGAFTITLYGTNYLPSPLDNTALCSCSATLPLYRVLRRRAQTPRASHLLVDAVAVRCSKTCAGSGAVWLPSLVTAGSPYGVIYRTAPCWQLQRSSGAARDGSLRSLAPLSRRHLSSASILYSSSLASCLYHRLPHLACAAGKTAKRDAVATASALVHLLPVVAAYTLLPRAPPACCVVACAGDASRRAANRVWDYRTRRRVPLFRLSPAAMPYHSAGAAARNGIAAGCALPLTTCSVLL